jgi:hypothetical protein
VVGTLAVYHVQLGGQPVRGAVARVAVQFQGKSLGVYQTDPTDATGNIYDFNPTQGTGATPGSYSFFPIVDKASGRCRDDQPMSPSSYVVRIEN